MGYPSLIIAVQSWMVKPRVPLEQTKTKTRDTMPYDRDRLDVERRREELLD